MKIRILQFEHPQSFKGGRCCCACRDICLFTANTTFDIAIADIKKVLLIYVQDKNFTRLRKMGWKIIENSIIPPNFVEKELVEYASDFFEVEITNYQIVEIDVETEIGG
nr:hypothetical protein [Bacteroides intestinalis]